MEVKKFSKSIEDVAVLGDIFFADSSCNVLCIHGGGIRGRIGFQMIRKMLADKKISSCSFDFKGHGETGGKLSDTSLEDKANQVFSILSSDIIEKPITLIASSMGGYVAIKTTELCIIENLILIAPAIYSRNAYTIPFGGDFSTAIRKSFSWIDSDAWELLNNYKGNLLIIKAEKDEIIPEGVIERIYDSAKQAKTRKIITIKNATHPLTAWLDNNPIELEFAVKAILKII